MKKEEENHLIAQAQAGDERAITTIVEKYKGLVVAFARRRYLRGGDIEDLIQEGTLGLVKAIRQYSTEKGDDFAKFASISIINKINDAIRADNRDKNKPLNEFSNLEELDQSAQGTEIAEECNPLTIHLANEKRKNFYDKLNTIINPTQMQILELYLEGYTYKEIGQKLNLSEKKVDNRLHTIKNKIREARAEFADESGD